jgi:hypothetical protein
VNKYITAVTTLDLDAVREFTQSDKWVNWSEPTGKNALHYLCAVQPKNREDEAKSLDTLKHLLSLGMDSNSVHRIAEKNSDFPATPLWYAYTRGRNETLYKYLLANGAKPVNCWWAIAWYDDIPAAELFLDHGAVLDGSPTSDELFVASVYGKKYDFAKWLLKQGADVNAAGPAGLTAIILAVKRKDEHLIRWLIKEGADPDKTAENGASARTIVEAKGPKRLLQLLT